ncbi:MAG: hypothetical protein EAZ99_04070 [Alphaproteobacteria bacterium]|nr:MAG: hypothetical protein EAZ99_04070 [Alphaproteobacteria bacterium]
MPVFTQVLLPSGAGSPAPGDVIYVAPSDITVTVSLVNDTATAATVRLAVTPNGAAPGSANLIWLTQIPPGNGVERTAIVLGPGHHLFGRSDVPGVALSIWGV